MNPGAAKGKNASTAVTKYHFVKLDTAASDGETVKAVDTAGEMAYGVSLFSVSTDEIARGKGVSVVTEGRMILVASEAIAVGAYVSAAADGRARNAVSADVILGVCDEPASGANVQCSVRLDNAGVMA
jgi:hypothetical protein